MTQIHRTALAACLIAVSVNAIAGNKNTPAAPFGIEMGSPGSCAALPKKLKSIDPRVSNSPAQQPEPLPSDTYSYEPMDKVFPGARKNMLVMCVEGKVRLLWMSVERGAFDSVLLETLSGLDQKYMHYYDAKDRDTIRADGGLLSYYARETYISVDVFKERDFFSVRYQYEGPLSADSIKAERRRDEDKVKRKNAL